LKSENQVILILVDTYIQYAVIHTDQFNPVQAPILFPKDPF